MPGFMDKLKSGADKAAFEVDRQRRLAQAQSALKTVQRELETQTVGIGQKAVALYDAGALTQPELLELFPQIEALRQRILAQEAEVERIRQEKAPGAAAPAVPASPAEPAPEPTGEPQARFCPNCGAQVAAGVRFCPECGTKLEGG